MQNSMSYRKVEAFLLAVVSYENVLSDNLLEWRENEATRGGGGGKRKWFLIFQDQEYRNRYSGSGPRIPESR